MFRRSRCVQIFFKQAVFGSKESPTMHRVSHTAGRLWARSSYYAARLQVKSASSAGLPSRLTSRCVTVSPPLMAPFSALRGGTGAEDAASRRDQEVQPGVFRSPITNALWEIRKAEIDFQGKRRAPGEENASETLSAVPPSLSRSAIHYPFSTDPFLREGYRNPSGLVRIGRMFEDLDALAGNVAAKHCSEDPSFPLLVTASVDRIVLKRHPPLDSDITLTGRVVWTGRSSMRRSTRCVSSPPGVCYVDDEPSAEDGKCWLDANFTFVARDRETGRSRSVSPLDLEGINEGVSQPKPIDEDEERSGDGQNDGERDTHKGWKAIWRRVQAHKDRQTLERRAAKKASDTSLCLDALRLRQEAEVAKLVAAGFPLLRLPALADPHAVLMRQTALSSTLICMPQQRNTANRIFGGFLMHRAYEVGFWAAFMFGGSRPTFSEIDEVVFLQPVDVGDLVHLEACVLYTKQGDDEHATPQACVEVLASVVRPESVESKVSNRFNLTFSFPELLAGSNDQARPLLRTVLPADATEASRIVMAKHRHRLQQVAHEETRE
ncbi:unnamed protein product [Ascophyllum nodosum]